MAASYYNTRDGGGGDTGAGGLGGVLSDVLGGSTNFRASRGRYTGADAQKIKRDREMALATRGQEAQFTQYLQDAARGNVAAPSVAQAQLAQSTAAAQKAAAGQAASARGPSRALAQRSAANAQASLQGAANAQGATMRAQESMAREQMVAQGLRDRRLADMQAQGLSLEEANAKLQAEMKAQEINSRIAQGNAEQAGQYGGAALMAIGSLFSDERGKVFGRDTTPLELDSAPPEQKKDGGLLGGILSDLKEKRALEDENASLREALRGASGVGSQAPAVDFRAAPARRFVYKDPSAPGAAPGPQVGTNAQDLERTDARFAVKDTPQGKMVDPGRVALALAPAVGEEQRRTDEQEARISTLEEALRIATRGSDPGTMELGFDRDSGIYRTIGSVPGETNEERIARELEEQRRPKRAGGMR